MSFVNWISAALLSCSAGAMALSVGCGSNVETGGGGAGGEGAGGEGAGGEDAFCSPYNDVESSGPVTFHVVNQTGQDIYLRGSCAAVNYSVDPATGPDGTFYGSVGGTCQQSCEVLQSDDPVFCEADACAPSSVLLPAGETLDVTWGGQGQKSIDMPAECWLTPEFGTSCQQIVAAKAGSYNLNVAAFSECGDGCTCDAAGLCTGDATGLQAVANSTVFDFPSGGAVEILFDICAFGCAD